MSISQQLSSAGSLLSAVDAVRNVRALLVMLGALVAGALVWGLGALLAVKIGFLAGALFFLAGAGVAFYGANAAGIMIMDEAKGLRSRPIVAALVTSLATSHRLLLALLLFAAIYLLGLLALAIVLLICKIPFIGPLLYTVVFPVSVVIVGVAIFALYAVVFPLSAPAVWDGAGTMQTVSRLLAIARSRIVNVLIMMALLFFLVGVVGGFIALIMVSGTLVTGGMSAAILDMGGMMGMMGGLGGMGDYGGGRSGSYMLAAGIGGGVVYAIAFSLPALVYLRGCCQVYLGNLQGVDVEGMEAQLREKVDAAKRKAEDLRAQATAAAAAAQASASSPATASPPPSPVAAPVTPPAPSSPPASVADLPVPPAPAIAPSEPAPVYKCAQCGAPFVPGDAFCGECGHKLA
ncbi:hypothetical protein ACO2Q9_14815 [Variovorax sp. VNK109]|uniref:hypothetical protein n=1 Tax=Variovorax sp. VNK109 TaxID=3400919 RepID=UPI003BFD8097